MTGKFHQLCRDYDLTGITFNEQNVFTIKDKNNNELSDIKTPEDNETAADFMTEIVRQLSRDENCALHVSIAGGRKTMGYYLGYALSLYGRSQDRLSHVLVSENYESLPTFFYPTVQSVVIHDRNGAPLDTKEAKIMLAQIPFVHLRAGLPEHLLEGKAGFSETIALARSFDATPQLTIDLKNRCFYANSVQVKMSGVNFAFYLWMIEQTVKKKQTLPRPHDLEPNRDYVESFLKIYSSCTSEGESEKTTVNLQKDGMSGRWISERMSAVKTAFERALGQSVAKLYCIKTEGKNSNLRYFVPLQDSQINYKNH